MQTFDEAALNGSVAALNGSVTAARDNVPTVTELSVHVGSSTHAGSCPGSFANTMAVPAQCATARESAPGPPFWTASACGRKRPSRPPSAGYSWDVWSAAMSCRNVSAARNTEITVMTASPIRYRATGRGLPPDRISSSVAISGDRPPAITDAS